MNILKDVDMGKYTSIKAGGIASKMVIPNNLEELQEALSALNYKDEEFIVLGNGSNTLVSDKGYKGTVLKLGPYFNSIEVSDNRIVVGAGALMSEVAKIAMNHDLTGFEPISGIPGSLGGALFMNAGAYGGEISHLVERVTLVTKDGSKVKNLKEEDLNFGYRHSIFQETGDVVTSITLRLAKGVPSQIREEMDDYTKRRNDKQPLQYPSCGSFFKRPEGYFAGKLIEDSGLRGATFGDAMVSEKHCGFIINKGNATASDVIQLKNFIQEEVYKKFGVSLEPEVRIIGE